MATLCRLDPAAGDPAPGPTLLAIESAGSACSAAVVRGEAVLAAERRQLRHGHAEALMPIVRRAMEAAGISPARLDAVAAAVGPGGFTGIRVGLAAAHGIALAAKTRLIGVSCFAATAAAAAGAGALSEAAIGDGALLVALDSRRTELYVQLFARASAARASAAPVPLAAPEAVLPDRLAAYIAAGLGICPPPPLLLLAGNAAEAAAQALDGHCRLAIAANSAPDALGVAAAGLRQLQSAAISGPPRPLYLRPPDVTLPQGRGRDRDRDRLPSPPGRRR